MASFCALDLIVNYGLKDVTLLTFGQPRIGNVVFASHFKMYLPNAIRVTNAHDIVPHLPRTTSTSHRKPTIIFHERYTSFCFTSTFAIN